MIWRITILTFLSISSMAQSPTKKWYTIDPVGYHVINELPPQTIDPDTLLSYFEIPSFKQLSPTWLKGNPEKSSEAILQQYHLGESDPFFQPQTNERYADVEKLSATKVQIAVLQEVGSSRWHHYLYAYYRFTTDRNPTIDSLFGLNELEAKFSVTYKGIEHGSSMEELRQQLGEPDYQYPGQTLQLQQLYYEEGKVLVRVHNFKVYYIEQYDALPEVVQKNWLKVGKGP